MIGIEMAHRTLSNAALFLGAGSIEGPYRAKVIGNGLRELDRFLNILIDEVAAEAGWHPPALVRLRRQRNTANKLHLVLHRVAGAAEDLARLRALALCRDCLFYCNGIVRRGDRRYGATMTMGWPATAGGAGAGQAIALGARLDVASRDLGWVCKFYERIAADLVAQSGVRR